MGGIESDCEIDLEMRSGLAGTVEISRTRNLRNTCVFAGERGTLEAGVWDPDPEIVLKTSGREIAFAGHARRAGAWNLEFGGAFIRQLDDFVAAIREGREPLVPGREGRRSIDLIQACYAVRRPLELPWTSPPQLAPLPAEART
jgi:predicted dehydrogenase